MLQNLSITRDFIKTEGIAAFGLRYLQMKGHLVKLKQREYGAAALCRWQRGYIPPAHPPTQKSGMSAANSPGQSLAQYPRVGLSESHGTNQGLVHVKGAGFAGAVPRFRSSLRPASIYF